jgi:hypothetical protein
MHKATLSGPLLMASPWNAPALAQAPPETSPYGETLNPATVGKAADRAAARAQRS